MPDLTEQGVNNDPGEADASVISSSSGASGEKEKKDDKKRKYRKAKLDKLASFTRALIARA